MITSEVLPCCLLRCGDQSFHLRNTCKITAIKSLQAGDRQSSDLYIIYAGFWINHLSSHVACMLFPGLKKLAMCAVPSRKQRGLYVDMPANSRILWPINPVWWVKHWEHLQYVMCRYRVWRNISEKTGQLWNQGNGDTLSTGLHMRKLLRQYFEHCSLCKEEPATHLPPPRCNTETITAAAAV